MVVNFKANTANTGAAGLNVNSLGATAIKKDVSTDLETGDILANQLVSLIYDGTNFQMLSTLSGISNDLPRGYIDGFICEQDTDTAHDTKINIGVCRDTSNNVNLSRTSAITKQIDASWAEGTNAGGLPTAVSLTTSAWYHLFAIHKTSDQTVDAGWDRTITAASLLATASAYAG
jgi:hypothetical protein